MKTVKFLFSALILVIFSAAISAQTNDQSSTKTESFKVFGKCEMCKARIEKTVTAAGATSAAWDSKTQILTVTFNPSKTNKDAMSKKLAAVGHDTEKYRAPDDVYASLPGCCHYERAKQ
jgi:periplasmic mercuric ion binding protein